MWSRRVAGLSVLLCCAAGCKKKDEAPAPLASAVPVTTGTTVAPAPSPSPNEPPAATATAAAAAPDAAAPSAAATAAAEPAPSATDAGAAKKVSSGGSIKACCAALTKAAQTDKDHANRYKAAAAVCAGLAKSVNVGSANLGAARTTLRAQLQGVPIPGGC